MQATENEGTENASGPTTKIRKLMNFSPQKDFINPLRTKIFLTLIGNFFDHPFLK